MPVYPFRDQTPRLDASAWIAPNAQVIGDVEIGAGSSVWFGTVVRGDVFHIRIGARVNLQDNSVVHVTTGRHATIIGDDVTVGHRAILHGCTIEAGCLIGMGAIVMDRVQVGAGSIVAAGALLTEGTIVPPGSLVMGSPARVRREVNAEEARFLGAAAAQYQSLAAEYAARLGSGRTG